MIQFSIAKKEEEKMLKKTIKQLINFFPWKVISKYLKKYVNIILMNWQTYLSQKMNILHQTSITDLILSKLILWIHSYYLLTWITYRKEKIITKSPLPFIFRVDMGKYVPLNITYAQSVRCAKTMIYDVQSNFSPSTYVRLRTREFCIPMISHWMMECFGPKNGKNDPIKIIEDDEDDGEKKSWNRNWIIFGKLFIFFKS